MQEERQIREYRGCRRADSSLGFSLSAFEFSKNAQAKAYAT